MPHAIRILAVDDSVTIRKALELILVPAGYHVEFAVNGAEAVEKAKALRPDIVLLDFILPDMRGTEVCRELLADAETRAIPVVLISARGAEIRQAYHDVEDVVDYLTKPFTPDAVLGVLNEVLSAPPREAAAEVVPAAAPVASATAAPDDHEADFAASAAPSAEIDASAPPMPGLPPAADAEDDGDEVGGEEFASEGLPPPRPRDDLEAMFETLRAGLEGVYVEEMDTPAGAAADRARSYTDLASRLARQLGETLEQAESQQRHRLYGDGSIRSLDESLLDTYRRVCRLLFRAVGAGALAGPSLDRPRPRVLVLCPRESESYERLTGVVQQPGEAELFVLSSDYRQLPMLARFYAPTHVLVDAARSAVVWDQLRLVRQLPEARRMQILAVSQPGVPGDLGVAAELSPGSGLQEEARRRLGLGADASAPLSPPASPPVAAAG